MSQYDFGVIDPFIVNGEQLADMLNTWRDAMYTIQRGPTRPAFVVPGMPWVNDSAGPTDWVLNFFFGPGVGDRAFLRFNSTTGDIFGVTPTDPADSSARLATTEWVGSAVGDLLAGLLSPGSIIDFAGVTAPAGWLICNGASYPVATYPNLHAVILYRYGGSGANFNVPDLGGVVTAGVGPRLTAGGSGIDGMTVGASGGAELVTLAIAHMPGHTHAINLSPPPIGQTFGMLQGTGTANAYEGFMQPTGGGQPHQNTQPTMIMNKLIKT